MYRYGEDFYNEEDMGAVLDHFLQRKQAQESGDMPQADGAVEKNTENMNYLFDR